MTSFDLRVQQWLQKSTITAADKITIMQNTIKGLEGYRLMTSKETPTDQPLRLDPKFVIQWPLVDAYQRDVRKLEEDIRTGTDSRNDDPSRLTTEFMFGDSNNIQVVGGGNTRCGGASAAKTDADGLEKITSWRPIIEAMAGSAFECFEAVSFTTQVVAGTNWKAKIKVANGGVAPYIHARVFVPLPYTNAPPECTAITAHAAEDAL